MADDVVPKTFRALVESAEKKYARVRDLPAYGRWGTSNHYFHKVFKAYMRLWKYQQENRMRLLECGLQRWEIGEIASRIGQLYFSQYMRTSEARFLLESCIFYEAILNRKYFEGSGKDRMVRFKELRFYARFLMVSLILNRTEMVNLLVEQFKAIVDDSKTAFPGTNFKEWRLVVQEIVRFARVHSPSPDARPLRYCALFDSHPSSRPYVARFHAKKVLKFRDALLTSYHKNEAKFAELTLDTYRMLQCLEWEPSGSFYQRSPVEPRANGAVTDQSITSGLIDINLAAEMMDPALPPNPKKAVLYRPNVPLLISVVATMCEELPPESVVLIYISASGNTIQNTTSHTESSSSSRKSSKNSVFSRTSHEQKSALHENYTNTNGDTGQYFESCLCLGPSRSGGSNNLYPGDLIPFTRRPLFLIIDSDNSDAFKAGSTWGRKRRKKCFVSLSSEAIIQEPRHQIPVTKNCSSLGFVSIFKTKFEHTQRGEMEDEEEKHIEMEEEDVEKASSDPSDDSFINDDDSDDPIMDDDDDDNQHSLPEEPLTDKEIEELIAELLETESKAAEAQEALEEESVSKVEADVREELSQTLKGDELENAVADEMATFKEEWETVLDELETESAHLLEQLDGAGIELPSLYKWIESQAPHGCCTEAWKNRTQWVGSELTSDLTGAIADAEKYLQIHRPVGRKHGKVLEEGASGFLAKKLAGNDGSEAQGGSSGVDWGSFSKLCSDNSSSSMGTTSFGSKDWSSVYLASTPQQAAELGLKFPGVDEVEEIDDIEDSSGDPFVADAIANERELNLSEEQKRKFKKVKEEDDLKTDLKLRRCLKQRRHKNRQKLEEIQEDTTDVTTGYLSQDFGFDKKEYSTVDDGDAPKSNEVTSVIDATVSEHEIDAEAKGLKLLHNFEEMEPQSKKARIIIPDSDEEDLPGKMLSPTCSLSETEDQSNPQRDGDNVLPVSSLPVCNEKQNFRCTACDKVAIEVHAHPLLRVVLCLDCKTSMKTKMQDVDCSECYCRWCGRCSDLLSCKSCKRLFCSVCIRRNLGEEILTGIKTSGWQCCCCSPSILLPLVSVLEKIMESQGLVDSNTDTDSDNSDADINEHKSTKRRPKKKIRRILDDTELGEETKRKIAIEKERQERLKSLGAKFSSKTMFMDSGGCSKSSYETGSLEMLGDIQTGYIVNVVREEGEEAVRIPRSISAKLKSHQVAGIRFMWENIIQSIRKVKAGDKGLGCILAHTMGLGKTFQVISFLYAAMRCVDLGLRTALIVTPVSVLHNWRQEFIKWEPSEMKPLRVFMLEEVPRERRAELLQKWRVKGGVFLIGYTAFRNLTLGKNIKERHVAREICQALQDGPDILVCDEAHIIKNTRADVTQALKQVKCQRRIALTGSPLQNNLMEYYCMVDFVREGFLGSSHEFRNRFQNPIENGQHTNSTADDVKIMNQRSHILYEQLKGFVQRMDMNVVKMDLPPKTVYVMSVKLSPLQRKLYKRFLDVHGFTKDKVSGEKIMKRSFFAGYQALAQIWNHPGILQLTRENRISSRPEDPVEILLADDCSSDENTYYNVVSGVSAEKTNSNNEALKKNHNGFLHGDWWSDLLDNNCKEVDYSGKMVLLLDILTMSSNVGDKALVFSQSLSTLDLIEQYLSKLTRPGKKGKYWKRRKDWYRIDGRTESSERQKLVDCFNSPLNRRVKCVLISTRAGSLGINLYAANRVIIVDGSWNPTHDLQAIYRAWRYGQTKPVFAYRLLAHGTMEEKIYKRQVTKEGLAARVVDRQQVHRTISKEEMLHLFEFGDDESCDIPLELKQVREHAGEANSNVNVGSVQKQKLTFPNGSSSSDKLMQSLIDRHHPRWIANYHEHESLLQENEDEKLSKEEQEMAWEVYRRSIEWEERRVLPDEPVEQQHISTTESLLKQKPFVPRATVFPPADRNLVFAVGSSRCRLVHRKCTKLSHLLTLRSQGTKWGCSTVCGECAQEIKWEGVRSAK